MKYCIFLMVVLLTVVHFSSQAQEVRKVSASKDSVVQLYGIVMTADTSRALPSTSIFVEGTGRGTIANSEGIFSIAVNRGDKIRFSCVGFKDISISIPENLKSNQYSVVQFMSEDTVYLPAMVIKSRPTPSQFEREFLNTYIPNDKQDIAMFNNDAAKRRALMDILPADGREAYNTQLRKQSVQYYSRGQIPPMNILNPLAWTDFVKAWKRGDFASNN